MRSFVFFLAIMMTATCSYGQGCYGGQAPVAVATAYCGAQQQVAVVQHVVSVPVAVQQVQYVQQQVAVAAPVCQQAVAVAAPQYQAVAVAHTYVMPQVVAVAAPVAVVRSYSVGVANYGSGVAFNQGFVNQRLGVVGGGVQVSARDRTGTVVNATGAQRVDIRRDLAGRVRSVQADGRGRGLLGRFLN